MADDKQQTTEQFPNEVLREVFQDLHSTVVITINADSVIKSLFQSRVISGTDIGDLDLINHRYNKCRHLLAILCNTENPRAFIELRQAINDESTHEWLVKDIDERYELLAAAAAAVVEPQVTRVSSYPSLTPLDDDNGDVTETNPVNDDSRRAVGALTRVFKENVGLKDDKERSESEQQSHNNPQLLFTLDQPPTNGEGDPRQVFGLVTLDKYLYVLYEGYNIIEVFDCEDRCKKIKDIEVKEMKSPRDMVGSSVTSQLFISECTSDVIWRLDSKTGVSDTFIKTEFSNLSLVENRLLVTSDDSLLMFDIVSGERIKKIPLTEDIKRYFVHHAIESNRDSFFVCYQTWDVSTVSEINSEGRMILVFDNKQLLDFNHMVLDAVGRLIVACLQKGRVVLLNEHLKYERILIDSKNLDSTPPLRLNYDKNNNRLTVGLSNGQVKIFEY